MPADYTAILVVVGIVLLVRVTGVVLCREARRQRCKIDLGFETPICRFHCCCEPLAAEHTAQTRAVSDATGETAGAHHAPSNALSVQSLPRHAKTKTSRS
jgi:hypothetical protein